jgi:hypothetical protein
MGQKSLVNQSFLFRTLSKIGFWFKIAAGPSFPALLDSASILLYFGASQTGGPPEADRRI